MNRHDSSKRGWVADSEYKDLKNEREQQKREEQERTTRLLQTKGRSIDVDLHSLLRTTRKAAKEIPEFGELLETYGWLGDEAKIRDLSDETKDLYGAYRKVLNRWLHGASGEEIFEVKSRLDSETLKVFEKLGRPQFDGFWQPSNQGMPNWLLMPNPFFLIPRQQSKLMHGEMTTHAILRYGKSTLKMSGPVLHAEDNKVLIAAIQFKNRTKLRTVQCTVPHSDGGGKTLNLTLTTALQISDGLVGLAKEMYKNHPWNQSTQKAIWKSLGRLTDCRYELTIPPSYRSKAAPFFSRIHEDEGELVLQFNPEFLSLYGKGFQQFKQLKAYFQTSDKAGLLFNYITRQREFKEKRILNAISIRKLCIFTGLSGVGEEPEHYILVKRVREAAEELYDLGLIGTYSVTDKKFEILGNKNKN